MKSLRLAIVRTIVRKEIKEMFDSPQAYIVLAAFLILWEYLFFPVFIQIREASLQALFAALPWLFIIFIPAVTMRSVSQEKEQGTLELILTHPVTELELLWGKFGAAFLFTAIAVALTLPIVIISAFFGRFDWGAVVSGYLGALYMAGILISLGLFVSSTFKNALTALIVSVVAVFFLVIIGFDFVTQRLPLFLQAAAANLSILSHFAAFARGVIDLRDVLYGALAITVFMGLAYLQLRRMKLGPGAKMYQSLRLGITLIIAIAIVVSIIGFQVPGRLDLTEGRLYTLAPGTRGILKELKNVVHITLYSSANLPAQLQPGLRDIQNLLRDYEIADRGNLIVQSKNPDQSRATADEASRLGIAPIQFNIIGQGEFQAKAGYLGLVVQYADKNNAVPLVLSQAGIDTSALEYQLTSAINELTATSKPTVAFLTGHGERDLNTDFNALKTELTKQFTVQTLTIDDKNPSVPADVKAVVLAGPTQSVDNRTKKALASYLAGGGSALLLIDRLTASAQAPTAAENKNSFAEFLEPYHVSIDKNIAYDLRSNENVAVGNGSQLRLILPYPLWVKALRVAGSSAALAGVASVVLPWTSAITTDMAKLAADKETVEPLFATTPAAGLLIPAGQDGGINITPNQPLPAAPNDLSQRVLAVAITKGASTMRLIVVGNSWFLTDAFIRQMPENLNFGLSALEWLGQGSDLASIRSRNTAARPLQFTSPAQVAALQYGNYAFVVLFPLAVAVFRLSRRRAITRRTYQV